MDNLKDLEKKTLERKNIEQALKKYLAKGGKIKKIKKGPVFAPNAFAALLGGDSGVGVNNSIGTAGLVG